MGDYESIWDWKITVPATSANLGPGFDCLGMALGLYNDLYVKELPFGSESSLEVFGEGSELQKNTDNLIYKTYCSVCHIIQKEIKPVQLKSVNRIPFARGLGSSSAAIITGILLAQVIHDFPMTQEEMAKIAVHFDGHMDNVLACLFGGVILGAYDDKGTLIYKQLTNQMDVEFHVLIPDYEVKTRMARDVLPQSYAKEDVVYNLGHLGLLVTAFITNDAELLGKVMRDRIHEPYRASLIHDMGIIKERAYALGALSVNISGSGSTVLITSKKGIAMDSVVTALEELESDRKYTLYTLPLELEGAKIYKDGEEKKLWR